MITTYLMDFYNKHRSFFDNDLPVSVKKHKVNFQIHIDKTGKFLKVTQCPEKLEMLMCCTPRSGSAANPYIFVDAYKYMIIELESLLNKEQLKEIKPITDPTERKNIIDGLARERAVKFTDGTINLYEKYVKENPSDQEALAILNYYREGEFLLAENFINENFNVPIDKKQVSCLCFVINNTPVELTPERIQWWDNKFSDKIDGKSGNTSKCSVCFELKFIPDQSDFGIALKNGTIQKLVSSNKTAFEHDYSPKGISCYATCVACQKKIKKTIEYLLKEQKYHISKKFFNPKTKNFTYITYINQMIWTNLDNDQELLDLFEELGFEPSTKPEKVLEDSPALDLISKLKKLQTIQNLEDKNFFTLELKETRARAHLQNFTRMDLKQLISNFNNFVVNSTIPTYNYTEKKETTKYVSFFRMLEFLSRGNKTSEFVKRFLPTIMKNLFYGTPLPYQMLIQCNDMMMSVELESETKFVEDGIALSQLIMRSNNMSVNLNLNVTENEPLPQLLGRLAVISNRIALASLGKTYKDPWIYKATRFIVDPLGAFNQINIGTVNHLEKLKKSKDTKLRVTGYALEKRYQEIYSKITNLNLPKMFQPEQKAMFWFGKHFEELYQSSEWNRKQLEREQKEIEAGLDNEENED